MKKSNKEFVAEFMNQLDSGKLVQVIQGLLNQEEITVQDEPIVVSKPEIIQETAIITENNDSNITIEKLSVTEKQNTPNFMDDDDEKVIKWFAERSKHHFEPKKPKEVPIEQDVYGLLFTQEGKIEAERQKVLKEAAIFALLSPQEQKDALIAKNVLEKQALLNKLQLEKKFDAINAVQKAKLLPKDYVSTHVPVNDSSPMEKVEKSRREMEEQFYKEAEYRVDHNIPGRNIAESMANDRVKNDRLVKKINAQMTDKDYQESIFPNLVEHIKEVNRKNREYDEKLKLQPQIDAIEKELEDLLMKDLEDN